MKKKKKASGILLYTDTHYVRDTFKLSIHILHWDLYNVLFFFFIIYGHMYHSAGSRLSCQELDS